MPLDEKYGRVHFETPNSIDEDEPVVTFRAQDRLLPGLLHVYQEMCRDAGSPQAHLDAVTRAHIAVARWQGEHPTKTPDTDAPTPVPAPDPPLPRTGFDPKASIHADAQM